MTQDPIQPLADIGRRVLRTVRYLATPPAPDKPLESYESQVRDPVVALSGICNELLQQLAAAPVAAEPENLQRTGEPFCPRSEPGLCLSQFLAGRCFGDENFRGLARRNRGFTEGEPGHGAALHAGSRRYISFRGVSQVDRRSCPVPGRAWRSSAADRQSSGGANPACGRWVRPLPRGPTDGETRTPFA